MEPPALMSGRMNMRGQETLSAMETARGGLVDAREVA